jgi:hypothetical protein
MGIERSERQKRMSLKTRSAGCPAIESSVPKLAYVLRNETDFGYTEVIVIFK